MDNPSELITAFWGAAGGFIHEAARWVGLRQTLELPEYVKKLHYWLLTLLLVVMGGIVAVAFEPQDSWQAMIVGASAPALITRIVLSIRSKNPVLGNDEDLLGVWLRG